MYEELVERLRKTYTVCGWDDLKSAADAIEALESELDRLRRERDQAVEELHRNTDAVPVVRCKDCIKWEADGSYEFDDDGTKKL